MGGVLLLSFLLWGRSFKATSSFGDFTFAVGDSGMIYKIKNSELIDSVCIGKRFNLTGVYFVTENIGFVIGNKDNKGYLFKTMDGGKLWIMVFSFSHTLRDLYFISPYQGFLISKDYIFMTFDGGRKWWKYLLPEDMKKEEILKRLGWR